MIRPITLNVVGYVVPSPDRITGLGLHLFYKAGANQLTRDFLRCGALERWPRDETEVLALGCGAQQTPRGLNSIPS
jgi:hypothetical protein